MTCGPWRHENVFNIDMLDAQPFIYDAPADAEALRAERPRGEREARVCGRVCIR